MTAGEKTDRGHLESSRSRAVRGGDLAAHYGGEGLAERVLAALDGADLGRPLVPSDVAALDQFHVGGAAATRRLAALAGVASGMRILDVGAGLGGPARLLAGEFGAAVTGIDITVEFCRIAQAIGVRTGLSSRVRICAADALRLPLADGAFDMVWSEHVAMNVADRAGLYRELARVARPGGRLALYDVVEGTRPGALTLPVPWARRADQSHLLSPDALVRTLEAAGWRRLAVEDETAAAIAWFDARAGAPADRRPGLALVMGTDFPRMIGNLRRNLAERRLGIVQAVFEKTA